MNGETYEKYESTNHHQWRSAKILGAVGAAGVDPVDAEPAQLSCGYTDDWSGLLPFSNRCWGFSVTFSSQNQWPFQEPKLEVPTKYTAYIRPMWGNIPAKYGLYMVQYLHFRILKFPLTKNGKVMVVNFLWMHGSITEIMTGFRCKLCS